MKLSTALIALAVSTSATIAPTAFAQSADLSIAGKIFPGACVIDLGNGGVADLGDIRKDTLNVHTTTLIEPVLIPASISCESEVRFALQAIDNAAESSAIPFMYGIGKTLADEKIGGTDVGFFETLIDGGAAYATHSYNGGRTWSSSAHGSLANFDRDSLHGFAKVGGVNTGPSAIKELTTNVRVRARIQPSSELTITEDVHVNGNLTLNLLYL